MMFRFYVTVGLLVLCLNSCKAIDSDNGASKRVDSIQSERSNADNATEKQHFEFENRGKGSIACPAGYAERGLC